MRGPWMVASALILLQVSPAQTSAAAEYHPNRIIVWFRPGVVTLPTGQTSLQVSNATGLPAAVRGQLGVIRALELRKLTPTATEADLAAIDRFGNPVLFDRAQLDMYVVSLADTNVASAVSLLKGDSANVVTAEPDWERRAFFIPNDPLFTRQWWAHNTGQYFGVVGADLNLPPAWDVTTGGAPVDVVVIDTGSDASHPDLAGRVVYGPNLVGPGPPYDDDISVSHGTSVSGIIAAQGNNGIGVAGVDWTANIVAIKALDSNGGGYTSDTDAAVDWARAQGYKIVNMSLGGGSFSATDQTVMKNAYMAGMAVFAAMGNSNCQCTEYPAGYSPFTVPVGAMMNTGYRWDDNDVPWDLFGLPGPPDGIVLGSNYGPHIRFLAPGGRFIETTRSVATGTYWDLAPGIGHDGFGGTSAATPAAAGTAALVQSLATSLTGEDLVEILERTAHDVHEIFPYTVGFDIYSGYGRLDAAGAVGKVAGQNRIEQGEIANVVDVAQQTGLQRTIIDWPGLPSGTFPVIRHIIRGSVSFSASYLAPPEAWARRVTSYGAGNENPVEGSTWTPNAWLSSVDSRVATFETYVYDVRSAINGAHVGWWPTTPSGVHFSYTTIGPVPVTAVGEASAPPRVSLRAAPNPAFSMAAIEFSVPSRGKVTLDIFDVSGRHVRRLLSEELDGGRHRSRWDLRDGDGRPVATGLYLVRLRAEHGTTSSRIMVLR